MSGILILVNNVYLLTLLKRLLRRVSLVDTLAPPTTAANGWGMMMIVVVVVVVVVVVLVAV